jgi:hypothetical protein
MSSCQKFILLASPRTGSQALNRYLNQYDGMVLHGEVLNPSFVGLRHDYHDKLGVCRHDVQTRDRNVRGFVERVFDDPGASFVGFHIFPDQTRAAVLPVLRDESVKKLWLFRNPVESFISLLEAETSGVWIVDAGDVEDSVPNDGMKRSRSGKVRFDESRFKAHLDSLELFKAKVKSVLAERGQPYLPLSYADIGDPLVTNAIISFLGGEQRLREFKEETLKQASRPLFERVANYHELAAYCRREGIGGVLS